MTAWPVPIPGRGEPRTRRGASAARHGTVARGEPHALLGVELFGRVAESSLPRPRCPRRAARRHTVGSRRRHRLRQRRLPSAHVARAGYGVTGIDFEESGLERARVTCPGAYFATHDLAEPLPEHLRGAFDVVVSAEVIEHLFFPRYLFSRAREALRRRASRGDDALSRVHQELVAGPRQPVRHALERRERLRAHQVLLAALSRRHGLRVRLQPLRWQRVGRVPPLASMIMTAAMTPPARPEGAQAAAEPAASTGAAAASPTTVCPMNAPSARR